MVKCQNRLAIGQSFKMRLKVAMLVSGATATHQVPLTTMKTIEELIINKHKDQDQTSQNGWMDGKEKLSVFCSV